MRSVASRLVLFLILSLLAALSVWLLFNLWRNMSDPRSAEWLRWWRGSQEEREELVTVQREACPGAPFVLPADGFIGLLYGDPRGPYSEANPHQGIDLFSNTEPGSTPVYAAYDGYLTREPDWKSSLILRVPDDPLNPGNQIWLYYTHMADMEGNDFIADSFAPGTSEMFVQQGTLLGYTGDYNGLSPRSIWVHLHFSVVKDDGNGRYLNELQFENTVDPAPYLGLPVNYACGSDINTAMQCSADPACS
jgi:hypothetical protein